MRIPSSAKTIAPTGCISANSGHSVVRLVQDGVVAAERLGQQVADGQQRQREGDADQQRPADHPPRGGVRALRRPRAPSIRPTRICPAIAIASSTSARKMNSCIATWCAASAGSDSRASTALASVKAASSDAGAHEQVAADAHQRAQRLGARAQGRAGVRGRAQQQHRERRAHPQLRDDGAERRAVEAEVEAVDEHHLEHDVHEVGDHEDDERRAQAVDATQVALAGERDQRAGNAGRREPQVARGEVGGLPSRRRAAP